MPELSTFFTADRIRNLITSLVIIFVALIIWKLFKRAYERYLEQKGGVKNLGGTASTMTTALYSLIKAIIVIFVSLVVLQINGFNVSSMLAGLGIASAIVGLAFQDMLKDIIMGAHILIDDFFKVGDVIIYDSKEWEVVNYNIRTTKLRNIADNSTRTVANRNFSDITRAPKEQYLTIPLPYEEDFNRINEVLAETCAKVDKDDNVEWCKYFGTQNFGDSAISYMIGVSTAAGAKLSVRRRVLRAVQEDLAAAGIEIPFNQLDVHIKGEKQGSGSV